MLKKRDFSTQSCIYLQDDEGTDIYTLRKGVVLLTYADPETGHETEEQLRVGDFFGMESSFGGFPRGETATALTQVTVVSLSRKEFEQLMKARPEFAYRTLQRLSKLLRKIGKEESALLENASAPKTRGPSIALVETAAFYLENKQFTHAKYAYSRYIITYPNGILLDEAIAGYKNASMNTYTGLKNTDIASQVERENATEGDGNALLERIDKEINPPHNPEDTQEQLSKEAVKRLRKAVGTDDKTPPPHPPQDDNTTNISAATHKNEKPATEATETEATETEATEKEEDLQILEKARTFHAQGHPQKALELLQDLQKGQESLILRARLEIELDHSLTAIETLSAFYQQYPQSPLVPEFLLISAQAHINLNLHQKASSFLKILLKRVPSDSPLATKAHELLEIQKKKSL